MRYFETKVEESEYKEGGSRHRDRYMYRYHAYIQINKVENEGEETNGQARDIESSRYKYERRARLNRGAQRLGSSGRSNARQRGGKRKEDDAKLSEKKDTLLNVRSEKTERKEGSGKSRGEAKNHYQSPLKRDTVKERHCHNPCPGPPTHSARV